MPQPERYEILILGSGEAGKLLAWQLARAGRRTAVVERRWIGGSCPNIDCLPSKNEIWSAKVAHLVRHGAQFGTMTGPVAIDMPTVRQRKRDMVDAPDRRASAELQGERRRADHGERAFRGAENARGQPQRRRDARADGREGLSQPRNARHHSEHSRSRSGAAAHPCRGSGARLCAGASDRARRRLCRPRAGPGLPSLRQPRHGHRAWTSAHGGREDPDVADEMQRILGDEGIEVVTAAETLRVHGRSGEDVSIVVRTAAGERNIAGSDILVGVGPHAEHRRDRPRRGRRRAGRARLHPRQRAAGDERPRRLGHRRMRRQPAVHARLLRRFSDHSGQSRRRPAQHARSPGALLHVHGPAARPGGTERDARRSARASRRASRSCR